MIPTLFYCVGTRGRNHSWDVSYWSNNPHLHQLWSLEGRGNYEDRMVLYARVPINAYLDVYTCGKAAGLMEIDVSLNFQGG